ncbi:MAG: CBS domain-containing protein [Acetobacteraceae bacterium]
MSLTAGDLLSPLAVTVTPETPLIEAVRQMLDHRVSGMLVVDGRGAPVGMLTEGDLLRRAELGTEHRHRWLADLFAPRWKEAARFLRERSPKVADVMTADVISVARETGLPEIVALMEKRGIKQVPVLAGGSVIGIVSRADILRALLARLAEAATASPGDTVLAQRLDAAMRAQSWVPLERVRGNVRDGVVDLLGEIDDERLREPLLVLARSVPGVKAVEDHLMVVEVYTGTPISSAPEGPHG